MKAAEKGACVQVRPGQTVLGAADEAPLQAPLPPGATDAQPVLSACSLQREEPGGSVQETPARLG